MSELILSDVACGYLQQEVVTALSATIRQGEVTSLLGRNGVGKSTLFKTILGLTPLLNGSISTSDGAELGNLTIVERARLLAYVPQFASNPFAFRAIDIVVMGRTAHLERFAAPSRGDEVRALDALAQLDAAHLADKAFLRLSGGEKQIVMIARALVQEPEYMLLDEPTSSLDFGNQARVLAHLQQLASSGMGVVMTTHSPDHAALCGGQVILLKDRHEHLCGPPDQVLTSEHLSAAYGIPIEVGATSAGSRQVPFFRPCIPTASTRK